MPMWDGRFKKEIDSKTNDFNSSLNVDNRLYKVDILGSSVHAKMLGKMGIISKEDSEKIINGLNNILNDIENGNLKFNNSEDIHMFVEEELTKRIGDTGKKLHTARSRNDQVALDNRLYIKGEVKSLIDLIKKFIYSIVSKASENTDTIMPGYTHLQRAQPITFAHHLMAYAEMFMRDIDRLNDLLVRMNVNPLGSCALAGTTHNIDRFYTSEQLGFDGPCNNSIDGVSDRDYMIELASALSIIMVHLSRFSEEVILWCSWEFKFIELDDAFSTGSSIMPQKKNPDIPELIRGKSGRVFGNNISLLTMMKGIPLAYNKDMQEDKEAIFDSLDNVRLCIETFIPMFESMKVLKDNMLKACKGGFINATDAADYLVRKGIPFREAYKIVGTIVSYAIDNNKTLEELNIDEYKKFSNCFEDDIYEAIDFNTCVNKRKSYGAPSEDEVKKHIEIIKKKLTDLS